MPAATAVAGVAERGEEWADAIDAVVASGVARKVNLIGHSQGGLDARYVVAGLGYSDKVASVTTIATPHRGTVAADLAAGVIGLGPFDGALLDEVVGGLIGIIGLQGDELTQQLDDLTRDGAEGFNQAYPDDPDVVYRSWAGRTCRALDFFCQWDNNGEVVDLTLALAYELTVWNEGPNDGLVSVASSEWGEYQGALPADHLDQVGQIADPFVGPFDHVQFFLDEAATLRERGF
jgi:triacylglycerol esterase/lipase EstA (alpha/beta hydrolase family)